MYIPEKYFVVIHDNIEYYIRQLNQAGEEEFIYKSLYNKNLYINKTFKYREISNSLADILIGSL